MAIVKNAVKAMESVMAKEQIRRARRYAKYALIIIGACVLISSAFIQIAHGMERYLRHMADMHHLGQIHLPAHSIKPDDAATDKQVDLR